MEETPPLEVHLLICIKHINYLEFSILRVSDIHYLGYTFVSSTKSVQ